MLLLEVDFNRYPLYYLRPLVYLQLQTLNCLYLQSHTQYTQYYTFQNLSNVCFITSVDLTRFLFVVFLAFVVIVLSVLLQFTDSDYLLVSSNSSYNSCKYDIYVFNESRVRKYYLTPVNPYTISLCFNEYLKYKQTAKLTYTHRFSPIESLQHVP